MPRISGEFAHLAETWITLLQGGPGKFTTHYHFFQAWLLALEEAFTKDAWSPAYERRNFHGQRLLAAIEKLGPNEAA